MPIVPKTIRDEYDRAAKFRAGLIIAGEPEDYLPEDLHPEAHKFIGENLEAFQERAREFAYAMSQTYRVGYAARKNYEARKRAEPTEQPSRGGLSRDDQTLYNLVRVAADYLVEAGETEDATDAYVNQHVIDVAIAFDQAVWEALQQIVKTIPPKQGDATRIWFEDASYNIFMTLLGEGVGIWDGRWDMFYDTKDIRRIQTFLEKSPVGKFGSELEDAIQDSAYTTTEGTSPTEIVEPL